MIRSCDVMSPGGSTKCACVLSTWREEEMAKSIRSKRRQKVLAIRREKYREREKKKLWEKHLAIQAQRTVEMAEVEAEQIQPTSCEPEDSIQESDAMDTGTKKLSNSQLKKIQEKWSSSRSKKRKAKKLGGKKAHAHW